jgi:membrane protease YdiL (CAAX protease family)
MRRAEGRPPTGRWRESRWLAILELLLVVSLVVADKRRLVPFSKTPFYFVLAWVSLYVRGVGWRGVGFALPRDWRRPVAFGVVSGVVLEIFSSRIVEPGLAAVFGREADLADFRPLVGNATLLLLVLAANWTFAAFGEELVYRGYLMNRVAGLAGGTLGAWVASLFAVSALFGWGHVDQGVTGQVQAAVDGFMLGLLYLATGRNLVVPIVSHGVSNSLAFVLIYFGRYPGL